MRPSAFKLDVRLQSGEAARSIKSPAKYEAAIQKQQGVWCEAANFYAPAVTKLQRRMTDCKQVDRL